MCAAGGLRPLSLGGMAILKNATTPLLPGSRKGATFFIHTQSPQNQQIVQGSGSWVTERCKIKIADVGWLNWSLKKKKGGGGWQNSQIPMLYPHWTPPPWRAPAVLQSTWQPTAESHRSVVTLMVTDVAAVFRSIFLLVATRGWIWLNIKARQIFCIGG